MSHVFTPGLLVMIKRKREAAVNSMVSKDASEDCAITEAMSMPRYSEAARLFAVNWFWAPTI